MKKDLATKLWDITNIITGFSVAQTLGFLIVAIQLKDGLTQKLINSNLQDQVAIGVTIVTIAYITVILLCYKGIKNLLSPDSEWAEVRKIYNISKIAKILIIAGCGIITIWVIY